MTGFIIELEDNGQDFLRFHTDLEGNIFKTEPFQGEIWNGGYVPMHSQQEGDLCMMHKLPYYDQGYLKHKVIKITKVD